MVPPLLSAPLCPRCRCSARPTRADFRGLACLVFVWGLATAGLHAADPRVDHIERFLTNQVTIHFDTEANRLYELQFLDSFSCPANVASQCNSNHVAVNLWSNLYVAPKLQFPNHYVVVDYRTNRTRFYRLRVTP